MIDASLSLSRPAPESEPSASIESLFAPTHRWWKLTIDRHRQQGATATLVGVSSSVVWRGSVAVVPCPTPDDSNSGPCACGLHAPATALGRARSLASVVVGGDVRVLSVDHGGPRLPHAVVAIEGPLHVFSWCGGAQDGFTLERCARRPRWVVPAAGPASAFCRRHARDLPRTLRRDRQPIRDLETTLAASLTRRYGLEVVVETTPTSPTGSQRAMPPGIVSSAGSAVPPAQRGGR